MWLLLKKGATPRSFAEARVVNGVVHDTKKDAAVADGHLSNPLVSEATYALQEAVECRASPKQLRQLFVYLVKSGYPVAIAFDQYSEHFMEEAWRVNSNVVTRKVDLLQNLQARLNAEGCKSLSQLGITVPEGFDTTDSELQRARGKQFIDEQRRIDVETVSEAKNIFTSEQRVIFDAVMDACSKPEGALFDIQGRAGCGKTLLLNAIGAQARLNGHLTAPTASTGLAALNQTFGLTFHRTFDVPVPDPRDDSVLQSNLPNGKRALLMGNTKLSTIDEISSLHIAAYEAAARVDTTPITPDVDASTNDPVPTGPLPTASPRDTNYCVHDEDIHGKPDFLNGVINANFTKLLTTAVMLLRRPFILDSPSFVFYTELVFRATDEREIDDMFAQEGFDDPFNVQEAQTESGNVPSLFFLEPCLPAYHQLQPL